MKETAPDSGQGWSKRTIKELFAFTADVQVQEYRYEEEGADEAVLVYCVGLCDSSLLAKVVLPELESLFRRHRLNDAPINVLSLPLPLIALESNVPKEQISEWIFQGDIILLFPRENRLYKMNASRRPERNPRNRARKYRLMAPGTASWKISTSTWPSCANACEAIRCVTKRSR